MSCIMVFYGNMDEKLLIVQRWLKGYHVTKAQEWQFTKAENLKYTTHQQTAHQVRGCLVQVALLV